METRILLIGIIVGTIIGLAGGAAITQYENMRNADIIAIEVNEKIGSLQETARKCFWGNEYQADPKGTIEHFGEDNTEYYIIQCRSLAQKNWELMKE